MVNLLTRHDYIQVLHMNKILDSYWVEENRFMAGEYPGSAAELTALSKLEWLLSKDIDCFIDLTEPNEHGLKPYTNLFERIQVEKTKPPRYINFPIPDMHTPSVPQMVNILDAINNALADGQNIYLHCYGGIGRTGTVVGCYFVQHGMETQNALDRIAELRRNTPDGWRQSPETFEQRQMILNWNVFSSL
jgi:hypothetical protein